MEQQKDFRKTWITLWSISTILFAVIGLAMIVFDNAILNGLQYFLTSVILGVAVLFTKQKKINPNFSNSKLSLGFIFLVIGLTSQLGPAMIGMWALGVILFLSGLFLTKNNPK